MKVALVVALSLAAVLSGCADDQGGKQDALAEAAKAAEKLDVEATSTTGVIRGVVVDQAIRPLAGVFVAIQAMEVNATTNEDGAFAFEGLEAGTYFLQASMEGYNTIQQSVDVVAGVDQPEAIRILLAALPTEPKFIEALEAKIFITGSFDTPVLLFTSGDLVGDAGNYNFRKDMTPNATVVQTEFNWNPTSPLGENARFRGGTYSGTDGVETGETFGSSPHAVLENATNEDGDVADNVYYQFWAQDSAGLPAGVHYNQEVQVFIHSFHGFRPDDGWLFSRDGDHPVPE